MTDTPSTATPAARWPRWKRILLVASLALNLLVIGIVATAAVRHGFAPPAQWAEQATIVSFARGLPEERRRLIWDATRADRQALRPFRAELRRARAEVRAELTAPSFDEARYKAAHERLLDAEVRARRAAHSLFETVARLLTPAERRAFAEWQQRGERPWRRRMRHFDRGAEEGDGTAAPEPGRSQGPGAPANSVVPPTQEPAPASRQ